MTRKKLILEQRKLDTDLWIIAITTFIIYGILMCFHDQMLLFIKNSHASVLLRLLLNAAFQFGIAGLGITIVCILRRERFSTYGLRIKNIIPAILLSILCYVPSFFYLLFTNQIQSYAPLSIIITEDVLVSGPLVSVLGMLVIAIVWGFFEGFNYVVISDKINKRYPPKSKWLDWGAFICALVCILFHPMSFSPLGLVEIAATFVLIYGMLLVKKYTNNAWGCIFIFLFLWNAF